MQNNPSSDIPLNTFPMAAFSTIAWWDYGISCAGSCTDFTQPSVSVSSNGRFTMSSAPARGSASATASIGLLIGPPATGTSSYGSAASTRAAPSSAAQSLSATSAAPSVTNPSTAANFASPSTSNAAGPSCVGVPQDLVAVNITDWCSSLATEGQVVGCNNQNHDGSWLSFNCNHPVPSISLQYHYPDVTLWLNISLASDSTSFTIDGTQCNSALGTVLNGCPLTSGTPLLK